MQMTRKSTEVRQYVKLASRDVEAEVKDGCGSGGSGPFSVEAEARKLYRFHFHKGYST